MPRKTILGLIGGIGSGKSEVARELARHGALVINADALGHEALRQPAIREQIRKRWGQEVFNAEGEVDRSKLGAIVFGDLAGLRALEKLSFPWIEKRFHEEVNKANRDPSIPLIVLDAAVMLEAGWNKVCDRLIFVDAPRQLRLRRLAEQRGWTAKDLEKREQAQWPLEKKASLAHFQLDNSGSREHIARQVDDLLRQLEGDKNHA